MARIPLGSIPTFEPYLVVHTKSDCEWCEKAKAFLDKHKLFYRVAVHDDEQERQAFYTTNGIVGIERTMPQIMVHDGGDIERIGGYQQLTISGVESLRKAGSGGPRITNETQRQQMQHEAKERQARYEAERALVYGEPVFMLRALDQFAVDCAEHWITLALPGLGEAHPKIISARSRVEQIKQWQVTHGTKHLTDEAMKGFIPALVVLTPIVAWAQPVSDSNAEIVKRAIEIIRQSAQHSNNLTKPSATLTNAETAAVKQAIAEVVAKQVSQAASVAPPVSVPATRP